jgi:hypothetical protein
MTIQYTFKIRACEVVLCTVIGKYKCFITPSQKTIILTLSILKPQTSTAGPWPGTGPWHQLYRAARRSPGICHFMFLSIFHE